jgi:drug/metabolite transporter (DMT)-like permease
VTAHLLLLSAVIIWGWTFVATKILLAELGPLEIFALRLAIGLPCLAVLLVARRTTFDLTRADARPLLLGAGIFTLHFLIQIRGLAETSATNTGWIITITPLVMAILAFLFLRERLGWNALVGIVVATFGVVLLMSRGRITELDWLRNTGDWLVLASTLTWAGYTVVTRDVSRRRNPMAVTFTVLVITAVVTAVIAAAAGDFSRVSFLSPRAVVALAYLGVLGTITQWFWQVGVAKLGAARAGLYLYLEPLATVVLAVPVLGEEFGAVAAAGAALVLAGVYLGQRRA